MPEGVGLFALRAHPSGRRRRSAATFLPRLAAASNRWVLTEAPAVPNIRKGLIIETLSNMAEGVGFEPTVGVNPRRFSRPLHSTALPPLRRVSEGPKDTVISL